MEKQVGKPASVSPEFIAEIYRLYDETDMGYRKIAKHLDIGLPMVAYYLRKRKNNSGVTKDETGNSNDQTD